MGAQARRWYSFSFFYVAISQQDRLVLFHTKDQLHSLCSTIALAAWLPQHPLFKERSNVRIESIKEYCIICSSMYIEYKVDAEKLESCAKRKFSPLTTLY